VSLIAGRAVAQRQRFVVGELDDAPGADGPVVDREEDEATRDAVQDRGEQPISSQERQRALLSVVHGGVGPVKLGLVARDHVVEEPLHATRQGLGAGCLPLRAGQRRGGPRSRRTERQRLSLAQAEERHRAAVLVAQVERDQAFAAKHGEREDPQLPVAPADPDCAFPGARVVDAYASPHGPLVQELDPLDAPDHPVGAMDEQPQDGHPAGPAVGEQVPLRLGRGPLVRRMLPLAATACGGLERGRDE
jgi:hypothetical protein